MDSTYLTGVDAQVIRLELTRIRALLSRLGNPQNGLSFVHIAGTNGKGSTAACLASILTAAGYRTGLFTSPALRNVNERFRINGAPIPDEALGRVYRRVQAEANRLDDPPTEFERSVAVALLWFAESCCDLVVLEVGLGGAGDATNVIPAPEVCVFTAMGLDHVGRLGSDVSRIAQVKAGILKSGTRAVSFGNHPDAERVFAARCAQLGLPYSAMDSARITEISPTLSGTAFTLSPYGTIRLPLLGTYQPFNALLAVTAAEELRSCGYSIPDEAVRTGLSSVRWEGRLELLCDRPVFLLDGSHNPPGLRATLSSLTALLPHQKPVFLMGVMADKDVDGMLSLLLPAAERFITVTPRNPRAMDARALADRISARGGTAQAADTVEAGVGLAMEAAGQTGAVCALGTLYFSGDVRTAVRQFRSRITP